MRACVEVSVLPSPISFLIPHMLFLALLFLSLYPNSVYPPYAPPFLLGFVYIFSLLV